MTPDQRFTIIITLITISIGGVATLIRSLWRVSQQWVLTGRKLEELTDDIGKMVLAKDKDHTHLQAQIDRLEQRAERHEEWHTHRLPPV
jgi:biopolymer transport protein ExbB/TolQ